MGPFVDTNSDAIIAVFTVVLTFSTIGLWAQTKRLAEGAENQAADTKRSLEIAETTANATKLSADAALALELPLLRIAMPELLQTSGPRTDEAVGGMVMTGPPGEHLAIPGLDIRNDGRTHAFPEVIYSGFHVGADLPDHPPYRFVQLQETGDIIRSNDDATVILRKPAIALDPEQRAAIAAKDQFLWFFVQIWYADFMDEIHHHGFCWYWGQMDNVGAWGFLKARTPPYVYIERK